MRPIERRAHASAIAWMIGAGVFHLGCAAAVRDPVLPCPGGFDSTFIQIGERELAHGVVDWERDLDLVRSLGITRVVLQYSGDEHGAFDDRAPGIQPVRALLAAASELDMRVLVGLYLDPRWPSAFPVEAGMAPPIDRPSEMGELALACTSSPACAGWYLPEELNDRTWSTPAKTLEARNFIARSAAALRRFTPRLDIAVSPFFTGALDPATHARWWGELLADRQVNLLMLQDGVGSGNGTAESAAAMLGALRPVTDMLGVRLWSTVEAFRQVHAPPRDTLPFAAVPAELEVVLRSIELERSTGAALNAFTVLDYMDPRRGPAAAELYSRYAAFCEAGRARRASPPAP